MGGGVSVHKKLNQARTALAKRKLEKTGFNKFAGYNYFTLGDFIQPAQEIFGEVGLCGVVSFTETIATLTITDIEDNSQIVITSPMGSAALKGVHEVQNIGAVETYQRRYLWVAALEIVEHDALDETVKTKERSGVAADVLATGPKLTDEEIKYLDELAAEVLDLFKLPDGAKLCFERVERDKLDDMQKVYLSSRLPSNVRNPIKKYSQQYHAAKQQPKVTAE
jgi:hypothetical protein